MAEVIRCDRCGKIMEEKNWVHKYFKSCDVDATWKELDICDECQASFNSWLAQDEPYVDTDILVRMKKDLELKSKLADKRKEEIEELKRRLNAIYGVENYPIHDEIDDAIDAIIKVFRGENDET